MIVWHYFVQTLGYCFVIFHLILYCTLPNYLVLLAYIFLISSTTTSSYYHFNQLLLNFNSTSSTSSFSFTSYHSTFDPFIASSSRCVQLNQGYRQKGLIQGYKTLSSKYLHTPQTSRTRLISGSVDLTTDKLGSSSYGNIYLWNLVGHFLHMKQSPTPKMIMWLRPLTLIILISISALIRVDLPYMGVCTLAKSGFWKPSPASKTLSLHNSCTHPQSRAHSSSVLMPDMALPRGIFLIRLCAA
jgi:hypothetical protein